MDRIYLSDRGVLNRLLNKALSPIITPRSETVKLSDNLPNRSIVVDNIEIQLVPVSPWPFNFINGR